MDTQSTPAPWCFQGQAEHARGWLHLFRAMFSWRSRSTSTTGSLVALRPLQEHKGQQLKRQPLRTSTTRHACTVDAGRENTVCGQKVFACCWNLHVVPHLPLPLAFAFLLNQTAAQSACCARSLTACSIGWPSPQHLAWRDALFAAATSASTRDTCLNFTRFLHLSLSCTPVRSLRTQRAQLV